MQKLTPFLWFDTQAEEAMNFYLSVFKNSKVHSVTRYPEGSPAPAGSVMTAHFQLEGLDFTALNAGPQFKFTEAISFVIDCKSQEEVDYYWEKLTADGGEESMCGWLKDKFGLSWQVVPEKLLQMVADKDHPEKAQAAMQAMMQMRKIHLPTIEKAYNNA